MDLLTASQIWIMAGAVFLIIELFTTSFFALFLGIGAFVTAVLVWMGFIDSTSAQLLVFGVFTGLSTLIFRDKIKNTFQKSSLGFHEFVGDRVRVVQTILPVQGGKVLYRGAEWTAYSANEQQLDVDTFAVIKKVDGISLIVE
jgi:inner membrane protein